jgi:hypothetical protein
MSHERSRAVVACLALLAITLAANPGIAQSAAQSGDGFPIPTEARPKHKPINLELEASSHYLLRDLTRRLNDLHDRYRRFKKKLQRNYNIQYSLAVSIIPQWGKPNGGPGAVALVYTPTLTWDPFTNTAVGSGSFTFAIQQTQFWTTVNTADQQARLGLITPPNVQPTNLTQYNQLMYTHTFPGGWSWLSATVGQYSFAAYDSNEYAGSALANFISYPLAQNGTQTYPNGGAGAYAQAATADQQFTFAGGAQHAANVSGDSLTTRGLSVGKYAYFMAGEWAPSLLGGGAYSLLGYSQPSVPEQPSSSRGLSFNAVQNIDSKWGLFLRANGASGTAIPIEASVAWGAICNDPFHHNRLDQLGLGVFWNKTNLAALSQPARNAEWGSELYYNFTVFKGLRLTPDFQLYVDPALHSGSGPAAVLTVRTTAFF